MFNIALCKGWNQGQAIDQCDFFFKKALNLTTDDIIIIIIIIKAWNKLLMIQRKTKNAMVGWCDIGKMKIN